jgi:hypothetical protein
MHRPRALPVPDDNYMYSMNLEPHVSVGDGAFRAAFDIDEHYISECRDRAITLEKDPGMHYVSAPHMMEAQWDLLELIMESYARDYPQYFSLEREGAAGTGPTACWTSTTPSPSATRPPCPTSRWSTSPARPRATGCCKRSATAHCTGAGIATQRADYSLRFNLGMSWEEFHGPVPLVKEIGMLDRALKFLLRLRTGHPVRRLNWSLTVNPRLDVSAESLPEWAPDRTIVTAENAGKLVYLRIELQPLHRCRAATPSSSRSAPTCSASKTSPPTRPGPGACTACCATWIRNWSTTRASAVIAMRRCSGCRNTTTGATAK